MVRTMLVAAALATGVATVPAFAASCDGAATQSDMTACYADAFKAADKALNATYRKIEGRLGDNPDARKLLVAAERAWIAFRDAECAFSASGVEGGSIHPMMVSICMTDLTTARTRQLTAFLHCQEGDMSCPVPGE